MGSVTRDWRGRRIYEGCRVIFAMRGGLEEGEVVEVGETIVTVEMVTPPEGLDFYRITMPIASRVTVVDGPYGPVGHGSDVGERFEP